MPRCTVCDLPALTAVNRALVVNAVSISELSRRYEVSRQALLRHRAKCLPKEMVEAHAEGADDRAGALLAEIEGLKDEVQELMRTAKAKGDTRGAVVAIREGTRLVELLGKLRGDLQPPPTVQINLLQTAEFQAVSARIIAALADHSAARERVIQALRLAS